ncbi:hypothetical protein P280DRAFT_436975 [Massarina eburnea CBS 473.64]|uniref:Zn(2)-C6 fungal-type domain-containing protein n=1 Tax=Massarina eburnea CBS 473.64 TaxID=1395130 RepID=A0A6A6RJH5_9PLEO|nr:hypothetical protein P280DRAFT_436975 [Massarina eburnea CBS 473.64]
MENKDEDGGDGVRVQRACDPCRSRKIRCDRGVPCSNCRSSKLTCVTTAAASKPQRQRVHISEEYERKIDRIEDRLTGIERILESLAVKLGNLDLLKDSPDHSTQSRSHKQSSGRGPSDTTPAPFEGETTINRQSEFARELLEQAVGNTPSIGQNVEIKDALASLQEMVTRQGQFTNAMPVSIVQPFFNKSLADIDVSQLEKPPWDAANDLIEKASVYPTMSFAVVFPFLQLKNMRDIFKETFLHPGDATVCRRILVFGVLYNLFLEFGSYPVLESRVEGYRQYAQNCKTHLEISISQLDLYVPATYENILALLLASTFAIEMCKPSLCWLLITNAASLAQNLGYHRIQTMINDTEDERNAKINAFWFIYMMDKTLSLRLGRASVIQDWDMSLPYPSMESDHARFGSLVQMGARGSSMLIYWIRVGQIQGQVYERLFSPAAFCKSREERTQTATELVGALNRRWAERGEMTKLTFPGPFADIGDIFHLADLVMHHSTCAMIQRAVSPDNVVFDQDCLESARAALVAHQLCHKQFNVEGNEDLWSGYIHWSILQAPFTPFIVIFCNVVLHYDPNDLNSLADFVYSLESCRTISEGADKLYKMCHLFLQVAKLYVEAKAKESSTPPSALRTETSHHSANGILMEPGTEERTSNQNQSPPSGFGVDINTMNQFDPYLSALGLMPNSAWPVAGFPQMGAGTVPEAFNQAQGFDAGLAAGGVGVGMTPQGGYNQNNVQDWFSGSRYLMNLMEDDIQMPDFSL